MKLSNVIVNFYFKNNFISEEKKEIFAFGLNLIGGAVLNYAIILILAGVISNFMSGVIFIICFYYSRIFCGGFHAKSVQRCRVTFIGTFLLVTLIQATCLTKITLPLMLLINAISLLIILRLAPVAHPNRPLTQDEARKGKKKGIAIACVFILAELFLFSFCKEESFMITLTLLAVAVLMPIGIYTNRKEV